MKTGQNSMMHQIVTSDNVLSCKYNKIGNENNLYTRLWYHVKYGQSNQWTEKETTKKQR